MRLLKVLKNLYEGRNLKMFWIVGGGKEIIFVFIERILFYKSYIFGLSSGFYRNVFKYDK